MKPLTPNTPHVIIMVGIPGSGKTTFAEHFAKTFRAPYINPRDISELTIDAEATEKVTKLLFGELLKTNRTLIYEGSTYMKTQRMALKNMVTKAGYKALFVWVQTDPAESKHRATKKQKNRNLSAAAFDAAFRQFQNPSESEKPIVISGKHTYATQLKAVLKRLSTVPRPETPSQPVVHSQPRIVPGRNIIIR
ncbi:ATP-binding protein [Candidatus Saccharibacteria bacterium]|nr:ATP-binding protein [Candidatus Saccharibacteria bacterium]